MDCLSFDLALTNMLKQLDNKVIFLTLCMSSQRDCAAFSSCLKTHSAWTIFTLKCS